jgi:hypothetical protein
MNLSTTAHLYCGYYCILTDVCAHIYDHHAWSQEKFDKVGFDRFVSPAKVDLSLYVVPKITPHPRTIEQATFDRFYRYPPAPSFNDLVEVAWCLRESTPGP